MNDVLLLLLEITLGVVVGGMALIFVVFIAKGKR